MQQSSTTPKSRCREGVAEDCCMLPILLAVPSCTYSFWHGVIPTSYFIFNDFYTCFTIFLMQALSLCRARRDGTRTRTPTYVRACVLCICALDMRSRSRAPYRYRGRHLINGKMALYYTEIAAKTWISLSEGTELLLHRKDHARSKLRAFHVKIIVCRPLDLAVGRLLKKKKKKKKKKMEKIAVWPISV